MIRMRFYDSRKGVGRMVPHKSGRSCGTRDDKTPERDDSRLISLDALLDELDQLKDLARQAIMAPEKHAPGELLEAIESLRERILDDATDMSKPNYIARDHAGKLRTVARDLKTEQQIRRGVDTIAAINRRNAEFWKGSK